MSTSTSGLGMTHSARRINFLSKKLAAKRYLEIGVETGITFHQVDCEIKTGVDPHFLFDPSMAYGLNQHGSCDYHAISSDLFFRRHKRGGEPYDIVFIDGLHHFDQVMRDFVNALSFSHPRTVFVIDDTLPCDVFSAMRDQDQAIKLRNQYSQGVISNAWHGDVYLFVLLMPIYFPSYRFRTIMGSGGNPQTVVWLDAGLCEVNEWTQSRSLWASQNLSACGYAWLLENMDMLQPVEELDGLSLVVECLT